MKNIPLQSFFQETIPLQILTKTFSLFSPLVPKELNPLGKLAPLIIKKHTLTDCIHDIHPLADI